MVDHVVALPDRQRRVLAAIFCRNFLCTYAKRLRVFEHANGDSLEHVRIHVTRWLLPGGVAGGSLLATQANLYRVIDRFRRRFRFCDDPSF